MYKWFSKLPSCFLEASNAGQYFFSSNLFFSDHFWNTATHGNLALKKYVDINENLCHDVLDYVYAYVAMLITQYTETYILPEYRFRPIIFVSVNTWPHTQAFFEPGT